METEKDNQSVEEKQEVSTNAIECSSDDSHAKSPVRRTIDFKTDIFLLEDSTKDILPDYVNQVFSSTSIDLQKATSIDILSGLIYCIALEMGFATDDAINYLNDNQIKYNTCPNYSYNSNYIKTISKLPIKLYVNDEICKFNMKLYNYSNKKCLLNLQIISELMIVTFLIDDNDLLTKSVCVTVPRYVLTHKNKKLSLRLHNLKELSITLKDKLFSPIRFELMLKLNIVLPYLQFLPIEIRVLISEKILSDDTIGKMIKHFIIYS